MVNDLTRLRANAWLRPDPDSIIDTLAVIMQTLALTEVEAAAQYLLFAQEKHEGDGGLCWVYVNAAR
jgi:hypothetical protein